MGNGKQVARGKPLLMKMPDGSYSWSQPESNGLNGWEGFCGQTGVANLLTTFEKSQVSPHDVSRAAGDWTPGSKPSTLLRAITKLGYGSKYEVSSEQDLTSASPRNPIVTLLMWDNGGTYHYVSVIGVRGRRVIFNHWGQQDSLEEGEFRRRWGFKGGFSSGLVSFFGGMKGYTSIRRK